MKDRVERLIKWGKATDFIFVVILAQMLRFGWSYFFAFLIGGAIQYIRLQLFVKQVDIISDDLKNNIEEIIDEKINSRPHR